MNCYQKDAERTLIFTPDREIHGDEIMMVWVGTGLCGEAGEIIELLKKGIFHRHGLNKELLAEELGDLMWYLASLCTLLDLDLDQVMKANTDKLMKRYPNGYDYRDSIKRDDKSCDET